MTQGPQQRYAAGLALSASGMLVISPDALLLRLVEHAGIWDVAFYRSVGIATSLTLVLSLMHRASPLRIYAGLGRDGWAAAATMGASTICFVSAVALTTVANTLVILATMPLFSAVIGWVVLGERVSRNTAVAMLVALAGIVVIFADSLGGGTWTGDLFALAVAVLQSFSLVMLRRARRPLALRAVGASGFLAAPVALIFAAPMAVAGQDLVIVGFQGLVQIPLALGLFFSGTRFLFAAEVALLSLVETILGPLWAWLGVGEVPSALALAGGLMVLMAIAGNAAAGLRRRRTAAAGTG